MECFCGGLRDVWEDCQGAVIREYKRIGISLMSNTHDQGCLESEMKQQNKRLEEVMRKKTSEN